MKESPVKPGLGVPSAAAVSAPNSSEALINHINQGRTEGVTSTAGNTCVPPNNHQDNIDWTDREPKKREQHFKDMKCSTAIKEKLQKM